MEKQLLIKTVEEAKSLNENAQQELYKAFARPVYFLALKMLKNKEDAEDLMQETFLTAFQKLPELEEAVTFPHWLNRITANKCTNALKKRRIPIDSDIKELEEAGVLDFLEEDPLLIPEKYVDNAETSRIIMEVIDGLPTPQRAVIYYYYYEGLNIAQIAEDMAVSEGTVKSRLAVARDKIRKALEKKEKEEGIKLYAMPILIAPVIRAALQQFEMPKDVLDNTWENIASAQANSSMVGYVANAELTATAITPVFSLKAITGIVAGVVAVVAIIFVAVMANRADAPVEVLSPSVNVTDPVVTDPEPPVVADNNIGVADEPEPDEPPAEDEPTEPDEPIEPDPEPIEPVVTEPEPVQTTPPAPVVTTTTPAPAPTPDPTPTPTPTPIDNDYFRVEGNSIIITRAGYYIFPVSGFSFFVKEEGVISNDWDGIMMGDYIFKFTTGDVLRFELHPQHRTARVRYYSDLDGETLLSSTHSPTIFTMDIMTFNTEFDNEFTVNF